MYEGMFEIIYTIPFFMYSLLRISIEINLLLIFYWEIMGGALHMTFNVLQFVNRFNRYACKIILEIAAVHLWKNEKKIFYKYWAEDDFLEWQVISPFNSNAWQTYEEQEYFTVNWKLNVCSRQLNYSTFSQVKHHKYC